MYFYFVVIHGSKLVSDSNKGNDGHNNTMTIKLLLLTLSWELNIKCWYTCYIFFVESHNLWKASLFDMRKIDL